MAESAASSYADTIRLVLAGALAWDGNEREHLAAIAAVDAWEKRELVYEESVCVALHLLDHGRVEEARDELLGALPNSLSKVYREIAEKAAK